MPTAIFRLNHFLLIYQVPELKKLLKDSGLATSGNKAELIARLQEASGSGGKKRYNHND